MLLISLDFVLGEKSLKYTAQEHWSNSSPAEGRKPPWGSKYLLDRSN